MKHKLTYAQLREILALVVSSEPIRVKLADLLQGRGADISEVEVLDLINRSQVDKDMVRILSGQDPDSLDALDALAYITDFFAYMRTNKQKLNALLASIGLKAAVSKPPTGSKTSK
jgi:hypothetical protein